MCVCLYNPSSANPGAQGWVDESIGWVPGGVALHPKLANTRRKTGADLSHHLGGHEIVSRIGQVVH